MVALLEEPPKPAQIITQQVPDSAGEFVRYVQNPSHGFDPVCLDADALARRGLIEGAASAGRGNTLFFMLNDDHYVLRHYRRGGLVRHISKKHYLYTGLHRTRAMREFDILLWLQNKGLPAPLPYACRVQRFGLLYCASLVTHRLPGKTLAERLLTDGCLSPDSAKDASLWRSVGELIARFHAAGVFHADLNAHNIMLDDDACITLIDFDRGSLRDLPKQPSLGGWCLNNLNRLERSVDKIAATSSPDHLDPATVAQRFSVCRDQWSRSLT